MPHLYIVAGPNGAGKSLFSAELTTTDFEVFDGDKHMAELKAKYPETGSDSLENFVNEGIFKSAKEKAIAANGNFAFETNFSAEDPLYSMRAFKAAGYKIHLVFMGMNSVEECIQRVSIRVKAGGHKVSEEAINYNYMAGYANLCKYFKEFDTVTLYDNAIPADSEMSIPEKVFYWENGKIMFTAENLPHWVQKFIKSVKKSIL
ncbi:zeta toxin family protein [Chitinophaga niabensis]|uniref:Predicted ABC-type ATPase n=1 Tax=Chitinophaga niabensis TaxID=536979 RepID=A0A1N6K5T3_9BACT|nr:zeta toxin family protein [Chitinophaga niabensis]SIO51954.1 Predicted ABC-type ATPase [Chitinophaga niabensis]